MIPARQAARLFQGAHISLGTVTSLGRALVELRPDEIAYVIGTYMTKNAETLPDGRLLYRSSVGRAIRALWPGEDEPPTKTKREVTYALRKNGFSAIGRGEMFQGWEVPKDLQDWRETEKRRQAEEPEPRYVSPVNRSWICVICPDNPRFVSEEERDKHIVEDHGKPEVPEVREEEPMTEVAVAQAVEADAVQEVELRSCPVCGKQVERRGLAPHMKGHVITTNQARLLEVIRQHPGERRDFYIAKLGDSKEAVSGLFARLHDRDVVHRTGKTRSVRWWPSSRLDHDEDKSYVCDVCGQPLPTSRSLAGHRNREHGEVVVAESRVTGDERTCSVCGEVFPNGRAYGAHVGGKVSRGDEAHARGGEGVPQRRSTGRRPGRPRKDTAVRKPGRPRKTGADENGSKTQGVKGTDVRQVSLIGDDLLVIEGRVFRVTEMVEIDLQGLGVQR